MGFSPEVKRRALIDSARHCCICHKYKGVKIEVHHIIQESKGGQNTYENAIPLCFDCHADAGHYNEEHPIGTKFSIPELKEARNNWYQYVKNNSIPEKIINGEYIQTSYYVLHSFEIIESVLKGDFSSIKDRRRIYLASNSISKKWKELLESHTKDFDYNIEQRKLIEVGQFNTVKEYSDAYPDAHISEKSGFVYPYYEAFRKTDWNDLLQNIETNLFIKQLSESGIDAKCFCTSILHRNDIGCGDADLSHNYTEYIEVAPISFIFLGITNVSTHQLKLNNILTKKSSRENLPPFSLLPYEMVLVPIATAINLERIITNGIVLDHTDGERGQDFSKVLRFDNLSTLDVLFFENKIDPKTVIYNDDEGEYEVDIHEFDYNNLYSINSYWQCGSCPHLFFIKENGKQRYIRELLSSASNKKGVDSFVIPENVFEVVIRELEDEITFIDKIQINNNIIIENTTLHNGDFLFLKVSTNDIITIEGSYLPNHSSKPNINDIWKRNELIKSSNILFNLENH
jgi:hypothetical protein